MFSHLIASAFNLMIICKPENVIVGIELSRLSLLWCISNDPIANRISTQIRFFLDDLLPLPETLIEQELDFSALCVSRRVFHRGFSVKAFSICHEVDDAIRTSRNTHCTGKPLEAVGHKARALFVVVDEEDSYVLFQRHSLDRL